MKKNKYQIGMRIAVILTILMVIALSFAIEVLF